MERMKQSLKEAASALIEKPMLATTAERFLILDECRSLYRELPQPLRFSKILSVLLSRVSVPIKPHDRIAGRCVDRELTEEEEKRFQAFIKASDNPKKTFLFAAGHCTLSWGMLVEEGLVGLRAKAETGMRTAENPEKRDFFAAMIEVYDAISAYLLRYAEAAEQEGLSDVAGRLRRAATERPSGFADALQLLWIVTMIDCAYITKNPTLTLGRLDQILYPLYRADIDAGRLTREEAAAYITDYYCKHNLIMGRGEHQVGDESNSTTFDRILNFDAPQYLLLAGTDSEGALAVNELTELFAECIVPSFKNPVVVVRYVKDMDKHAPRLWRTLTEKALASASMMFYNDDNMIKTWSRLGLPMEDCRKYEHFGCNWPTAGEDCTWMQIGPRSEHFNVYRSEEERAYHARPFMRSNAPHSWPEDLLLVLRALAKRPAEEVTIEDVYDGFFARMSDFAARKLEYQSRELAVRKRRPSAVMTFGDCFNRGSLKQGECYSASSKYHAAFMPFQMFGTVADCMIAVDQLVFREKRLTLARLLEAVDADFVGFEDVLALCRGAEKYGMDTPLSNYHVERLSRTASNIAMEQSRPYLEREGLFLMPCMQSDTWHLKMGEDFGATPDGRRAHMTFSQNIRPSNGACVNGLTAMLNSIQHLPADGLLSGALNLDVDAKQFAGEGGRALFASLLATYFNGGGLHAQVSCATRDELLDAQKNPHMHRDLRVRITGYSGVFVDICRRLQDNIVARFE